jgi:predicted membrane protein
MDLSQASFAPGVTDIELKVVMGNVEIVFPEHVRVEYHGTAFMASVETLTGDPSAHADAECVVHVTGKAVMSNVSLMTASRVPH